MYCSSLVDTIRSFPPVIVMAGGFRFPGVSMKGIWGSGIANKLAFCLDFLENEEVFD